MTAGKPVQVWTALKAGKHRTTFKGKRLAASGAPEVISMALA